jgi:carbamoyl-phosphate synthase small subunit
LVFTYPMIGNYGVAPADGESDKIQAAGVIVSEASEGWSHVGANQSFLEWLESQNIPILVDVDTRQLTKHLRVSGTMAGAISNSAVDTSTFKLTQHFVSTPEPITYSAGKSKTVILVDCVAKRYILRSLLDLDVTVRRVPYNYDYTLEEYDGVLLSNGPGDPTQYQVTIDIVKKSLAQDKPVFGICLGSQLMGLAAGAKTFRLLFGHRGHNQPCKVTGEQQCFITSQNHGYAIDEKTLPKEWRVLFHNLNDNSVEGIEHTTKPFFSVQFHPEAYPGPTDTSWLFDKFLKTL